MPRASCSVITRELMATVRHEFVHIDWHGAHGSRHWARVRLHGLAIAERTQASARVVELFAFLHDARRRDEWSDPAHGRRSAELVRELGSGYCASRTKRRNFLRTPAITTATDSWKPDVTVADVLGR